MVSYTLHSHGPLFIVMHSCHHLKSLFLVVTALHYFPSLHSGGTGLLRPGEDRVLRRGPGQLRADATDRKKWTTVLQDKIDHGTVHGGHAVDAAGVCAGDGRIDGLSRRVEGGSGRVRDEGAQDNPVGAARG